MTSKKGIKKTLYIFKIISNIINLNNIISYFFNNTLIYEIKMIFLDIISWLYCNNQTSIFLI